MRGEHDPLHRMAHPGIRIGIGEEVLHDAVGNPAHRREADPARMTRASQRVISRPPGRPGGPARAGRPRSSRRRSAWPPRPRGCRADGQLVIQRLAGKCRTGARAAGTPPARRRRGLMRAIAPAGEITTITVSEASGGAVEVRGADELAVLRRRVSRGDAEGFGPPESFTISATSASVGNRLCRSTFAPGNASFNASSCDRKTFPSDGAAQSSTAASVRETGVRKGSRARCSTGPLRSRPCSCAAASRISKRWVRSA